MRKAGIISALILALFLFYGLGWYSHPGPKQEAARRPIYYVDPMHPAYRSDKPGIAPDCGMKLVPVYAEELGQQAVSSAEPGVVTIDAQTQEMSGIRVAEVLRSGTRQAIPVTGRVVAEDALVYRVNSGVDGFIRETANDSVGTLVVKDQKLATYYAPDFLAAASGFLAANERVPGAVASEGARSIQNYTDRLRNLGMSEVQIAHVASTRKLPESIDILAPADGVVLTRNISPGQHFEHDMELYTIADLRKVWVVAEVDQTDQAYLRPGTPAEVIARGLGQIFHAHGTNSLSQFENGGSTVKLRLEAENPKLILRPGMVVDVELPVSKPVALTVSPDALIDSGGGTRVYVEKSPGVFEPRTVDTGWRSADAVEIRKGLQPGERVVVGATFLVDSESRLRNPAQSAPGLRASNSRN